MMDLDRVNNYLARVEESEKTTFKPVGSRLKVGVDLGTAYIVLVVLDEENNPCLLYTSSRCGPRSRGSWCRWPAE